MTLNYNWEKHINEYGHFVNNHEDMNNPMHGTWDWLEDFNPRSDFPFLQKSMPWKNYQKYMPGLPPQILIASEQCLQKHQEVKQGQITNTFLLKDISELAFSYRTYRCLKTAEIDFVWELVQMSERQLKQLKYFGKNSLDEVKKVLWGLDLYLQMNLDESVESLQYKTAQYDELIFEPIAKLKLPNYIIAAAFEVSNIYYVWQLMLLDFDPVKNIALVGNKGFGIVKRFLAKHHLYIPSKLQGLTPTTEQLEQFRYIARILEPKCKNYNDYYLGDIKWELRQVNFANKILMANEPSFSKTMVFENVVC